MDEKEDQKVENQIVFKKTVRSWQLERGDMKPTQCQILLDNVHNVLFSAYFGCGPLIFTMHEHCFKRLPQTPFAVDLVNH